MIAGDAQRSDSPVRILISASQGVKRETGVNPARSRHCNRKTGLQGLAHLFRKKPATRAVHAGKAESPSAVISFWFDFYQIG